MGSVSGTSGTGKDLMLFTGSRYRVSYFDPNAWHGEGSNVSRVGMFLRPENAGGPRGSLYVFLDDNGDTFSILRADIDRARFVPRDDYPCLHDDCTAGCQYA